MTAYITLAEAAEALGVHVNTVRNRYRQYVTTRKVDGRRRSVIPVAALTVQIEEIEDPRFESIREDIEDVKSSLLIVAKSLNGLGARVRKLEARQ